MAVAKAPKKKGKSLDLEESLMTELQDVATRTGVSAMDIIRLCLKAGLAKIRADNFSLLDLNAVNANALAKLLAKELQALSAPAPRVFRQPPRGDGSGSTS